MKISFELTFLLFLVTSMATSQKLDLSNYKNLNIRNIGPANMSGRITAIDAVISNPNCLFVGSASGGVWKSENGGSSWKPVFDDQPTQNIGALAIHQSNPNVIWVGTGEGNPRNSMSLGMGIFKSSDNGVTWDQMGLSDTKTIHRIKIDPSNPEVVYVGAMGDPFSPDENRGLFKTINGGHSWKKILYTNDKSGIADLVMDPENPNKLIAAMYEHRRTPYSFTSGGPGSGLFLTLDGGDSWKKLMYTEGIPEGDLGRIGLAVAQSNPNRIYAKIESEKNALYRSDNGGQNWYKINDNPKFTNNRPFYFQELAVDPEDPERLYNIYQPLSVSYDGGTSFDPVPMIPADETKGIHADFHAFWVNPKDAKHFIIGGDGGIGITRDHGKSWYFPETIPVAQVYHVSVDQDRPYNVYVGMQDNGNWSGPGYTWKRGGIRTLYWQYLVGGDGFYIEPDLENSRFGYGTSQNGNLYQYDKVSGYYNSIKPHNNVSKTILRFNWNAALAKNPFNLNSLYYGSQFVHKTTDKGASWKIISPDLTTNNPNHQKSDYGGLTLDISGAEKYNSLLTIAPSPLDKNIIWTGSDDGQIHITRDGGASWINLSNQVQGMPHESWITQIQASNYDPGSAWMVVNNYRKGDYQPYLFKTDDFGKNWKSLLVEKNVEGYTLSVIQDPEEPNLVFLGTESGLWVSIDAGDNWVQFRNKFPSVSTMDLKIQNIESVLIIGTFGRAVWILDDLLTLRAAAGKHVKKGLTALKMNDVVQVKGLFIAPPGNIWTGFHTTFEGENRSFQQVEIPYYLGPLTDTTHSLQIHIFDDKGNSIHTFQSKPTQKGLNYVNWKLDLPSNHFSDARIQDEARGIPVPPGNYKVKLNYQHFTDSTTLTVLADPRFELTPEVDKVLFKYQKTVDLQVQKLADILTSIDNKLIKTDSLFNLVSHAKPIDYIITLSKIKIMKSTLQIVRSKGQTPKPVRQLGAWQTSVISPYSKLNDLMMIAKARTRLPSKYEWSLLREATNSVKIFDKEVNLWVEKEWIPFLEELKKSDLN